MHKHASHLEQRARRFQIASVAVVVLILSSSFGGPLVSAWLRSEDLLGVAFAAGLIIAVLSLAAMAWDVRVRRIELGIIVGILAVFVFAAVRMNLPEERSHLIEYAVLSALLFEVMAARQPVRSLLKSAFLAILMASCIGVFDELLQIIVPGRVFDLRDILFNFGASIGGATLVAMVARARRHSD